MKKNNRIILLGMMFVFGVLWAGGMKVNAVEIQPNDPRIHIDGINYPVITSNDVKFIRFNPTPNVGNKARTAPCGVIFFQTDSPSVQVNYRWDLETASSSKIFYTYQNGVVVGEKSIGRLDYSGSLSFTSVDPGNPVTYRIVNPNWGDPILTGITLEDGYDLKIIPDSSKPVCVAFGDSITHGTGQKSSYQGYAYQVAENFGWELYNCAVGGTKITTKFIYAQQLEDFPKVDYITLLYGFNDLVGGSRTVEEYTDAYHQFVSEIRRHQPYADLFCITLTATGFIENEDTGHTPDDFRAVVIEEVNKRIAVGDHHIHLVHGDQLSTTNDVNGGVHFSVTGAANFAGNLTPEISNLLGAPATPSLLPVWATNEVVLADGKVGVAYTDAIYPGLDVFDHQDDELFFSVQGLKPDWLTLHSDGRITGVAGSGDVGPVQFTVQAADGAGNSSTATIRMNVSGGYELGWVAPYDGSSSNTVGLWHMDASELGSATGQLVLDGDTLFVTNQAWTGSSLSDGKVYVSGNGTNFFPTTPDPDFTVEGWWKLDSLTNSHSLVFQPGSSGMVFKYVNIQGGLFKFRGPGGGYSSVSVDLLLATNEWFHAAFAWNASADEFKVYLNGALIGTVEDTNYVAVASSAQVQFGTTLGMMDEIRISDVARDFVIPEPVTYWAIHTYGIDEESATPEKDPDQDGYNNTFEYHFGMDPTNALNQARGMRTSSGAGGDAPALTYSYRVDNESLSYYLDTSLDLTAWDLGQEMLFSNAVAPELVGDGTARVTKYYTPGMSTNAFFVRIRCVEEK